VPLNNLGIKLKRLTEKKEVMLKNLRSKELLLKLRPLNSKITLYFRNTETSKVRETLVSGLS
jgi:hypothetical protein